MGFHIGSKWPTKGLSLALSSAVYMIPYSKEKIVCHDSQSDVDHVFGISSVSAARCLHVCSSMQGGDLSSRLRRVSMLKQRSSRWFS